MALLCFFCDYVKKDIKTEQNKKKKQTNKKSITLKILNIKPVFGIT